MGSRVTPTGLGLEYHGAGTVITYNSGASQIEILQEGSGVLTRWQTGGNDDIWLNAGTVLRPIPQSGWLYTLGTDGYLTWSSDPAYVPIDASGSGSDSTSTGDTVHTDGGPDIPPEVGPGDTTGENGSEELPGAVPLWMWLAGGLGILFVLSRR